MTITALAKHLFDKDVKEGKLPVGMSFCMQTGITGLCPHDCEKWPDACEHKEEILKEMQ